MEKEIISGVILEQEATLSLTELAQVCSVPDDFICQLVDADIVQPLQTELQDWSFAGNCLQRIRVSYRLHRDLEVNIAGIAIILDLIKARDL